MADLDNYEDTEILEIWERIKTSMNLETVLIKDREAFIQTLDSKIEAIPRKNSKDTRGDPRNLTKAGFSKRALGNDKILEEILKENRVITKTYQFRGNDAIMLREKTQEGTRLSTWGTFKSLGVTNREDAITKLEDRIRVKLQQE